MAFPIQAISQNQDSVEGDRQALVDLYEATDGDNWNNNSGWLSGNPSNDWHGVEVDSNGRVIKLDLYKNNLEGSLPASIGNLSKLRFLNVKGNPIYSEIPVSIANWTNAEKLLFASAPHNEPNEDTYNDHPGKTYGASTAKYHGTIPDVFDRMPNLRILQIGWQEHLDGQPYPSTLYQHDKIEILHLQGVKLTGSLEDNFNLPELRWLFLGNNQLEGELPSTWGLSTKLVNMKVSHSNAFVNDGGNNGKYFTGPVPDSFSNFEDIIFFFVSNQKLSGQLPRELFIGWNSLREIGLNQNEFEGEIPAEFGDKNIVVFLMANNNFSGELDPNLVSGMPNVILFDVRGNDLSGSVHPELWKTKKRLRSLNLALNNFSGPLPEAPDYVGDTAGWWLYSNNFTGDIPDSWINFFTQSKINESPNKKDLHTIQIHGNNLEGVMPEWFTGASVGVTPAVSGNKWTHRDVLENNVDVGWTLYPNQPKPFGEAVSESVSKGDTYSFDYSHRVHSKDQVQWTKNGSPLNGATSPILRIENFDSSDEGTYRLELTNSGVPPAGSSSGTSTVVSEPIELRMGESSGGDSDSPPSAPTLSSPSNESSDISTSPELSWNSVSNASSYRLQVAEDSGFNNIVKNDNDLTQSQQGVSGLEYETTYYWRVRAVNGDGSSDWSSARSFTTESSGSNDDGGDSGSGGGDDTPATEAPDLKSPADQSNNVSLAPEFEWTAVENADYYILHANSVDPTEMVIDEEVSGTTFTFDQSLDPETLYNWRVRAVVNGEEGEWSPIGEFTTRSEDSGNGNNGKGPQKSTPVNNQDKVKKNATFTWESVEDAESYAIEVREVSTSSLVIGEEVTDTLFVSNSELKGNTEYVWRVRATVQGQAGEWSDEWKFTTTNEEQAFEVEVEQNYPNPFNPSTNIRFTLAEQQEVSLKVYDMGGRLVASLIDNNTLSAGTHSASFNAERLASGIYFYRLITQSEIVTRKMTLMK